MWGRGGGWVDVVEVKCKRVRAQFLVGLVGAIDTGMYCLWTQALGARNHCCRQAACFSRLILVFRALCPVGLTDVSHNRMYFEHTQIRRHA